MTITAIEPVTKTRSKIQIDGEESFILSDREISLYDLHVGDELNQDVLEQIVRQLRSDALHRCGSLLKNQDYSQKSLEQKLERAGIPRAVAEDAVQEMVSAGYVNDRRLAEQYIRYHLHDKSRMRIMQDLMNRGIDRNLVSGLMEEIQGGEDGMDVHNVQKELIIRLMRKRHYDPEQTSFEDTLKLKAYLTGKGFSSDDVRSAFESYTI